MSLKKNAVIEFYKPPGVIEVQDSDERKHNMKMMKGVSGLKKNVVKEYYKLNGQLKGEKFKKYIFIFE